MMMNNEWIVNNNNRKLGQLGEGTDEGCGALHRQNKVSLAYVDWIGQPSLGCVPSSEAKWKGQRRAKTSEEQSCSPIRDRAVLRPNGEFELNASGAGKLDPK